MNYVANNQSVLVNHPNYTLSPLTYDENEQTDSFAVLPAILGAVGTIVPLLPQMGFGSRSRIKEADANTQVLNAQLALVKANEEASEKKSKNNKTLYLIGGTFLLVVMVLFFTLKS